MSATSRILSILTSRPGIGRSRLKKNVQDDFHTKGIGMKNLVTVALAAGRVMTLLALCLIMPARMSIARGLSQSEGYSGTADQSFSPRLSLVDGGAKASSTPGSAVAASVGYANVTVTSGSAPYGTAVFSFVQNGIVVSEVGVPASPPTTAARIFIDYRSDTSAGPGKSVDINTGFAVVNVAGIPANVTYTLKDLSARVLATGHGRLGPGNHRALFIDQLSQGPSPIAPDFMLPGDFAAKTQFGSLEITSDQPLSILALRMTTNQRQEVLFTSTPIADLTRTPTAAPTYFPQFVDGGGCTSTVILLNTSGATASGSLRILKYDGNPFTVVNQVDGSASSTFRYEQIPPGGGYVLRTDGSTVGGERGWVSLTPDPGTATPVGAGVFGCSQNGVLVTEAGIPAAVPMTHARLYIDTSGGHDTGLAIANPGSAKSNLTLTAFQTDGKTTAGSGPLEVGPNGQDAKFVTEFVSGLPPDFTGVLDVSSAIPFVAVTLRTLYNARHDFLLTTFPIADVSRPASTPIVFPQIADGGGTKSQFILLSAAGDSAVTFGLFGDDGTPLRIVMSFTVATGPYGIEFVTIPAGQFQMGTNQPDEPPPSNYSHAPERPEHTVVISLFFEMGEFEITQGQWKAVMGSNPSYVPSGDDYPVDGISWNDAQQFIANLNGLNDGYQYGLPTEAQWEYACRAGTTGDFAGIFDEVAWNAYNSDGHAHPVGTKKSNPWGLYDMHGNVLEWVQDWFDDTYYPVSPLVDPPGSLVSSEDPPRRAIRGGSWGNHVDGSTSYSRHHNVPEFRTVILGLRLMRFVK